MVVRDNIEKVWIIEDNKLIKANKIVSKVDYQGQEFAVLKTKLLLKVQFIAEMLWRNYLK